MPALGSILMFFVFSFCSLVVWFHPHHKHWFLQECRSSCDGFVSRASPWPDLHSLLGRWTGDELHQSFVLVHKNRELRIRRRYLVESEWHTALRCVLSPYGVFVNVVCPGAHCWSVWWIGYTDTPILDTNSGRDASYILKVEDVAATIIDGLKHDYSVIECNMV